MVLCMSRPQKHPRSGVYRARKAVPKDLRAVVGKRELIETLRTKDPAEAKRLHPAAMARLEAVLAAARAQAAGKTTRLTPRQIAEIAGEVYRQEVRDAEASPGSVAAREAAQSALLDRLDGEHGNDEVDTRAFHPTVGDIVEARDMLAERGIAADAATLRQLAVAIFGARTYAADVASRRAAGYWSPDPDAARFPVPSQRPPAEPAPAPPAASSAETVSMTDLLDRYARENPQQPKTMVKRRAALRQLAAAAGHDDAARIGKPDILKMKERRLAEVSPTTVAAEKGVRHGSGCGLHCATRHDQRIVDRKRQHAVILPQCPHGHYTVAGTRWVKGRIRQCPRPSVSPTFG